MSTQQRHGNVFCCHVFLFEHFFGPRKFDQKGHFSELAIDLYEFLQQEHFLLIPDGRIAYKLYINLKPLKCFHDTILVWAGVLGYKYRGCSRVVKDRQEVTNLAEDWCQDKGSGSHVPMASLIEHLECILCWPL